MATRTRTRPVVGTLGSPAAESASLAPVEAARPSRLLPLIVALPGLALAALAIARLRHGWASIDLPILDQALWNAARGRDPVSTIATESLLEDHFGPGMLAFAPLYRLVATPVWLVLGQAVGAWVAAVQIARRLERSVGSRRAAVLGSALLLSPPVAYALLYDVHSVAFAAPFALAAVFAVHDGRHGRALGFGLLAALFRADAAYGVLAAWLVFPGDRRGRLRPAIALGAYVAFATWMETHLGHTDSHWVPYYGHLGSSPADALSHPLRLLAALVDPENLAKALPWILTAGFLCLRRPRLSAPALAVALPTLLAGWFGTFFWGFHYGFAPTLLLAAAWVPVVRDHPPQAGWVVWGTVFASLLGGPFTPAPQLVTASPRAWEYARPRGGLPCLAAGIPGGAGVSAAPGAANLLAHRDVLYAWPYPFAPMPDVPEGHHLSRPAPERAARVDYVIMAIDGDVPHPTGFVEEARAGGYARYRRAGTTSDNPPSCAERIAASADGAIRPIHEP